MPAALSVPLPATGQLVLGLGQKQASDLRIFFADKRVVLADIASDRRLLSRLLKHAIAAGIDMKAFRAKSGHEMVDIVCALGDHEKVTDPKTRKLVRTVPLPANDTLSHENCLSVVVALSDALTRARHAKGGVACDSPFEHFYM
jgi:hypothetical protein